MAKYLAQLPDQYLEVEADSEEEAQNFAFAKVVRDLKPQRIVVWEAREHEEWAEP